MATNDEIEILLWEYIDGTCSEADMHRISVLINREEVWKQKYLELSAMHTGISDDMQLEQPSLRFTKNVMDKIATTNIAPATKKYININIIRGIAAFFLIAIVTMLTYAITRSTGTSSGTGILSRFKPAKLNMDGIFNSSTINVFIAINVALGLVLLDTVLRRKRKMNTKQQL